MPEKIVIDPVTRIEGHLKIEVEVEDGRVTEAHATGTLFRGLEVILQGRDPRDAQHITQRICGVCPISHGIASVLCLDDAFNINPPPNGRILRNLIQGANYLHSHLIHFYHLAALDYVKGPDVAPFVPRYEGDYRLPPEVNKAAVEHYLKALEIRRKAHELLAIFGARAPHTMVFVPGGVTEQVTVEKVEQFRKTLKEIVSFVDNVYVPEVMAVAEVYNDWFAIGQGCKNLLAYGAFPQGEPEPTGQNQFFKRGCFTQGKDGTVEPEKIVEFVKYSWYDDEGNGKHPLDGVTKPVPRKKGAYSWLKAPRYAGLPHEVGPLARMWVNQDPEVRALGDKAFSVMGRHAARALECSRVAHALVSWIQQLEPGKPAYYPSEIPQTGEGMGLTEAPRGALGHWVRIEAQKIANYQAVVPTTWNGSPRDEQGQRGPIEEALVGTPVANSANPIELVRVIRAFDPCIACAVHVLEINGGQYRCRL